MRHEIGSMSASQAASRPQADVSAHTSVPIVALLLAQAAAFALAAASGNIPAVVLSLFRALLTL